MKVRRNKRDYVVLMEMMVECGLSIRELSLMANIPKSTLHRNLVKVMNCVDEETAEGYKKLLEKNLSQRSPKGAVARWQKNKKEKKGYEEK